MFIRQSYCKAISGVAELGIVTVFVCLSVIAVTMLTGCDADHVHQRPNVTTEEESASMRVREERVLEAVRGFYREKGMQVPQRIRIVDRTGDTWLVYAGPESKEAGFEVDPEDGSLVKYTPGD